MITITATGFRAKCYALIDQVNKTGESLQITKRGKVVAELNPLKQQEVKRSGFGFAKGEFTIVGDIMAPLHVEWDAMK